jgi:hypothetical protein
MIGTILRGFFTAADNRSFELGRGLWALSMVALIACQGVALWKGEAFDPVEFGTAAAAILAAGGFGVAAKDKANASGS